MIPGEKKYLVAEPIVAWGSFAILLLTYWLTVAPTVSFWDCPEYVAGAYLLEVGHAPGNPVWMLVERMVTLLVPPQYAALAVNLSSGLFTAFAAFFLAKTLFRVGLWVLLKLPRRHIPAPLAAAGGALVGTLAFGWCDSVWYSAVEAEVYAMSIFMTSLCVWLMAKWAGTRNRPESWRLLILIAYLFGLSIGVHQLNLLCIPALAMIWAVRRGIRRTGKLVLIFLLSLVVVACVLLGMMPSTIALASQFELFAVNGLGWPSLSGVAIYVALLGISLLAALAATRLSSSRVLMGIACFPAIFLSGIFILSEHYLAGAIVSAVASVLLVSGVNFKSRRLCLAIWMLAMLLTGYSSYALIPVRGSVPSPANVSMPGEPFAFAAYQSREQYGSTPLAYGPTPYSRTMIREDYDSAGLPIYNYYMFDYERAQMVPAEAGARLRDEMPGASAQDSAENARLLARGGDAYIVKGYRPKPVKTPELNMWFPRITSSRPSDILAYEEWVGMSPSTMKEVEVSEAIDSLGRPVAKADFAGNRVRKTSHRPTYMQNAQWFVVYQTGYMYWRYLLWNFAGRQNDVPSQGEVQHGNFITGFPHVDNVMLGAEDYLPASTGSGNPGRNRYFLLPLALGVLGMGWLMKSRRRGLQTCAIVAVLFVMTGVAIVVYLNQGPAEPRERDYSFLGSYWAYCVWIGFGAVALARRFRSVWGFLLPLVVPGIMLWQNWDDHDRSDRYAARNLAFNILESVGPNAILFVSGDNYTFPLWYAQEVEGVRTDVRVVNLSYLTQPVYAANLMADWRESPALATTLKREDIIWDAFRLVKVPQGEYERKRKAPDALDALLQMRESEDLAFPTRYVRLRVKGDSTMLFDLHNLRTSGRSADFGKLMMFDIVATNAASPNPRPIYWLGQLGADRRIGLVEASSPWIFGHRFGVRSAVESDSVTLAETRCFRSPNPPGRKVYMDYAPAMQVASQRGALTAAGRRLLNHGNIAGAIELARKADLLMGEDPGTFFAVTVADTAFFTRPELGRLLLDCADSLEKRLPTPARRIDHAHNNKVGNATSEWNLSEKRNLSGENIFMEMDAREALYLEAQVLELRARGRHHLLEYNLEKAAWQNYSRALPARLRSKLAPLNF